MLEARWKLSGRNAARGDVTPELLHQECFDAFPYVRKLRALRAEALMRAASDSFHHTLATCSPLDRRSGPDDERRDDRDGGGGPSTSALGVHPLFAPLVYGVLPAAPTRKPRAAPFSSAPAAVAAAASLAVAEVYRRARSAAPRPGPQPRPPAAPPRARFKREHRKPRRHGRASAPLGLLDDDDGSPYALRPDDPVELHEMMGDVQQAVADGANPRTLKGERSAWNKYWVPFTRRMNTAAWRGYEALRHPYREGCLVCGFAVYVWRHIKPRRKSDRRARVDSVRNVLGHIGRKHDRNGQTFAKPKMLSHVLRGFVRRRIADYGLALPVRAEPFTADENCAMLNLDGKLVGGNLVDAKSRFWSGWRLVDTYADESGVRKSEIVGDDDAYYSRADVQLVLNDVPIADPSPEEWAAAVPRRDIVTIAVNVSKADFDGTKFGPSLVSSLYDPANPMSFAAAIIDYERRFPLRGAERRTTPLFTTDGVTAWTGGRIDGTLKDVMQATLTPKQRRGKTFHSKRVWVASALADMRSTDGEIQALVRWSSLESLRVYARMNLYYQARRRSAMRAANVQSLNATRRPDIDDTAELDDLEHLADALDE